MTIHSKPRDVLTAFKPKLPPPPRRSDPRWAAAMNAFRAAASECQNLAMETASAHPERFDEVSSVSVSIGAETQLLKTATLSGISGEIFDEMHRGDPNYTPGLAPSCEFSSIGEGA